MKQKYAEYLKASLMLTVRFGQWFVLTEEPPFGFTVSKHTYTIPHHLIDVCRFIFFTYLSNILCHSGAFISCSSASWTVWLVLDLLAHIISQIETTFSFLFVRFRFLRTVSHAL
jgi:hypothetical protein